jgi:eukaryotic-like serine/threonine-protein kinase
MTPIERINTDQKQQITLVFYPCESVPSASSVFHCPFRGSDMSTSVSYNLSMPSPEKLAGFIESVRGSNLLKPAAMQALEDAAAAPDANAEAIARDLVSRGLLSPYQAKLLWKGRGQDLFLNQYVLIEKLGEGGMGEVFRAHHTRLGRDVALKIMRRERLANPEAVKRFRREIKASAALAHENVVMAYDADQSGDVHFFAMEYVDGVTLDRLVGDKGTLPVGDVCDYVRQAALGLQHAHEQGLVHRDVKPSNLLLDKSGVVKISDLGLVLIDDPEGDTRITKEGLTVGTPDFVAPEQARNPRGADIRADIYSLGCTFYYLLTGEVPYPQGTPTEKMLKHSRESFPELKRTDVPETVKAILTKMTAKKPELRYEKPEQVADALQPFSTKKWLTPPPMPIVVQERLTDDELGIPGEGLDSRFGLPSSDAAPRTRNRGCLGMVLLLFGAAGVIASRWL